MIHKYQYYKTNIHIYYIPNIHRQKLPAFLSSPWKKSNEKEKGGKKKKNVQRKVRTAQPKKNPSSKYRATSGCPWISRMSQKDTCVLFIPLKEKQREGKRGEKKRRTFNGRWERPSRKRNARSASILLINVEAATTGWKETWRRNKRDPKRRGSAEDPTD